MLTQNLQFCLVRMLSLFYQIITVASCTFLVDEDQPLFDKHVGETSFSSVFHTISRVH